MKPPVNIDDLIAEWSKDAKMDMTEPGEELSNVPVLHAKYLSIMTYHNLRVKKIMMDYKQKRQIMYDYYDGALNNPEDLEKYNLPPNPRKYLKQQIPEILDSDKDLNELLMKKIMHEEIVEFCKSVLKELNNRVWEIRSFIDWQKFINP